MSISTRAYIEQLTEGVNDFIHIEYDERYNEYTIEFEYYEKTAIIDGLTEDECLTIAQVLYKVMNE